MKQCNTCRAWKEQSNFYKDKSSKLGITPSCKICVTKRRRLRAGQNKSYAEKLRTEKRKEVNEYNRLRHHKRDPASILLSSSRNRAQSKSIKWDLKLSDIIIPDKCPILQTSFIRGTKGNYAYTYSLDRIDNTRGYTKDNIQVISMKANTMKNSATPLELVKFAKWILSNDDIVQSAQIMENIESAELEDKEPLG